MDALDMAVYSALAVDAMQTRYIGKHCEQFEEVNPILGKCPNSRRVAAYFIASGLAYAGIKFVLPEQYKQQFGWLVLGVELGAIANNIHIGVRLQSGKTPEPESRKGFERLTQDQAQ